jgi:hypothetical protein
MELWTAAIAATGLLLYGAAAAASAGLLVAGALVGLIGGFTALRDGLAERQRSRSARASGIPGARLEKGAI